MKFHDLKDIVAIYSTGKDFKPSNDWDQANIVVWNPLEQREMTLAFTGSDRGGDENTPSEKRTIHFNVTYKDSDALVTDAFINTLKRIFPNIEDHTVKEYQIKFLEELIKLKK